MDPKEIEEMLARVLAASQPQVTDHVSKAEVEALLEDKIAATIDDKLATAFAAFSASTATAIAEAVQKAIPAPSREGVGRSGEVEGSIDEDSVEYLVQKAHSKDGLDNEDWRRVWGLFVHEVGKGMKLGND